MLDRAPESRPQVLFVYYTFSGQVGRVVDVMSDTLSARGCDVSKARIELTDPRYAERFSRLPMRRPVPELVAMLPAQLRRATGGIRIPQDARDGDYDLVVLGSPTWWLTTSMPMRSYLESSIARHALAGTPFAVVSVSRRYWRGNVKAMRSLGERTGGTCVDETHFTAAGGQVVSMLSWLAYMKHGQARERVLGLRVPPPNLQPGFAADAQSFASILADRLLRRTLRANDN